MVEQMKFYVHLTELLTNSYKFILKLKISLVHSKTNFEDTTLDPLFFVLHCISTLIQYSTTGT